MSAFPWGHGSPFSDPAPVPAVVPVSARWQSCPVCHGRGRVPAGFYGEQFATHTSARECRTCAGTGLIGLNDARPPYRPEATR